MITAVTNQQPHMDPRLEEILADIKKQRLESAASGAALVEKARLIAKQLTKNDLENKARILEAQVTTELNQTTGDYLQSLFEE